MDMDTPKSKAEDDAEQIADLNLFAKLLKNGELSKKIETDNSNYRIGCQEDTISPHEFNYQLGALARLKTLTL